MKKITIFIFLMFSLIQSYAQMEEKCLSLDIINDTLIVISHQIKYEGKDFGREYLFLNPFNKKVYCKFQTDAFEVVFLDSQMLWYQNTVNTLGEPITIFYNYDVISGSIRNAQFLSSIMFLKKSSLDSSQLFVYALNGQSYFKAYVNKALEMHNKVDVNLDCSAVFFNSVDTICCSGEFDYNLIEYKKVHPSIVNNKSIRINYFDDEIVLCELNENMYKKIIYSNESGKVVKKIDNLKFYDLRRGCGYYWLLGNDYNFYYTKNLKAKPIEIKLSELDMTNIKEIKF